MREWRIKSVSDTDTVYAEYANDRETGYYRYQDSERTVHYSAPVVPELPQAEPEPEPEPEPQPEPEPVVVLESHPAVSRTPTVLAGIVGGVVGVVLAELLRLLGA